jgi:translation initiation factor 1A
MPGKKKKKKKHKKPREAVKRELVFKNFQEEYAIITKKLGDRRMMVKTPDSAEVMAIIPGRFRKRCWFDIGDLCLISFREFQVDKVDIVYKYTSDERRSLCRTGEIPPSFTTAGGAAETTQSVEEDAFEFSFDDI